MKIKDKPKFIRGLLKILFALALTITAYFFATSGIRDISKSAKWSDENGETITDETGELLEISPNE